LLRVVCILTAIIGTVLTGHEGWCQTSGSSAVVAEIDGTPITLEDFNKSYRVKFRSSYQDAPVSWRLMHLNTFIDRSVAALEAKAQGLTPNIDEDKMWQYRRQMIVQELFLVYGRPDTILVSEESIRQAYDRRSFLARISAIMVDTHEEAEEIRRLLAEGRDFFELAKERGQGAEASMGGDLGWRTWQQLSMVPEIREAALEMDVGETSGVLKTTYGFHVVRLEGMRLNPQSPYEMVWMDIYGEIRRDRVTASMTGFRRAFEETQSVVVNLDATEVIWEKIQEGVAGDRSADAIESVLSRSDRDQLLVSFKGGQWTVDEFLDYCGRTGERFPSTNAEAVPKFVRIQTVNELLVREAKRRGLEDSPGMRERVKVVEEVALESQLRGAAVDRKFRISPSMAKAYYNEHLSDFMVPEGLHLRMIQVENRAAADSVLEALRAGADFEELARRRSVAPSAKEDGGDMGYIHKGRFGGLLDDIAFDLKHGETSGVFQFLGKWAIVQALDRLPSRQMTLEEANSRIVQILEPIERQRLYDEWIAGLREKYGVVAYPERLQ